MPLSWSATLCLIIKHIIKINYFNKINYHVYVVIEGRPLIKKNSSLHLRAVDNYHHLVIFICLSASYTTAEQADERLSDRTGASLRMASFIGIIS